jgi:putative PIN family toxin of toxin-antitoxin system
MTLRLVLDTNVVLDLFYWNDPVAAAILAAARSGAAEFATDARCLAELAHVLRWPPFALDEGAAQDLVGRYRAITLPENAAPAPREPAPLPRCKDRDDQKFLELARDAHADLLVTRDKALLKLARRKFALRHFRILAPTEAAAMLREPQS